MIAAATAAALEAARKRWEEEERLKAEIARKNAEAEAREAEARHLAWLAGLAAAAKETKDQLFDRRELRLEAMDLANRARAETEAYKPPRAALPAPPDDQERIRVATAPRGLRQVAERRDEPLQPMPARPPRARRG